MNLGQRLTALRNRKHLTQEQMAEELGVKRARYNAWENGISKPDYEMLAKIANFYHVTVDFLLGLPHREDTLLLTSDMYADGYTDESVLADLEASLAKEVLKHEYDPKLTKKDERDIAKELEKIMSDLEGDSPLAFNGEPLTDEDKELLKISLESSLRLAKQIAKKRFTPKKYRK